MGAQYTELFGVTRRAEYRRQRSVHTLCRQRQGDGTGIQRTLGDERRVLEDAAEADEEIGAVDHAPFAFDG
jgi:hypothetical protein